MIFDKMISVIAGTFSLIIIADVLVSYFLQPYHPVRENLDKIVQPMLTGIRKYLPASWTIDFSPIILLLIIEVIRNLLQRLF